MVLYLYGFYWSIAQTYTRHGAHTIYNTARFMHNTKKYNNTEKLILFVYIILNFIYISRKYLNTTYIYLDHGIFKNVQDLKKNNSSKTCKI